jgi:hypothetical protein
MPAQALVTLMLSADAVVGDLDRCRYVVVEHGLDEDAVGVVWHQIGDL